jgi:predicted alpha-1,6-mannanase (GH76 family)
MKRAIVLPVVLVTIVVAAMLRPDIGSAAQTVQAAAGGGVSTLACDAVCDGADAATAVGDNQPVPASNLENRRIALHIDNRGMAWATIESGAAGDEVWLDRSWDAGVTWEGSLGRTSTPGGATSARTTMWTARDLAGRRYGGALRACGRAVTGQNGSCTEWGRPANDRAAAAADALMYDYDQTAAWWRSSWWNSAVALTTLMDWMKRTGRTDYLWIVDRTFEVNRVAMPAGVKSGDPLLGNFTSRAIDDAEWWAIAWIQAYDLTRDAKYLNMSVTIANYVQGFWDNSCGGGVYWDAERTYKNAVTNGLYIRIAASLHNRVAGDTTWLNRATAGWNWFNNSGMINGQGLVNDGLNSGNCTNNNGTVWTYNQGLAFGAPLELYRANGDAALLTRARQIADAAMNSSTLTVNGILTESCDGASNCDDNQKQFKGIFMRYIMELADTTGVATYRTYAQRQADSLWSTDRDTLNRIGLRWNGQSARDWRTEASGLGALLAATTPNQPDKPPTTPPTTQPPTTPPTTQPPTTPPTTQPPTTPPTTQPPTTSPTTTPPTQPPTTPPTTSPPVGSTTWTAYTSYTTGQVVSYNGASYQCRQSHTALPGWEPPNVLALWLPI